MCNVYFVFFLYYLLVLYFNFFNHTLFVSYICYFNFLCTLLYENKHYCTTIIIICCWRCSPVIDVDVGDAAGERLCDGQEAGVQGDGGGHSAHVQGTTPQLETGA